MWWNWIKYIIAGTHSLAVAARCKNTMVSTKPKVTRKTVLLPIIGLVAFFLYIYLFKVDIPAIIATAQRADPILYVASHTASAW